MKLSPAIQTLSEFLAPLVSIEAAKDGAATVKVDAEAYINSLPEWADKDQARRLAEEHNPTFFAAATKTVGEHAIKAMGKNKACTNVEAVFPLFGHDTFTVAVDREKTYPIPGSSEKVTQYGVVSTKLDTVGAVTRAGQMKLVKAELQEAALKAFGN